MPTFNTRVSVMALVDAESADQALFTLHEKLKQRGFRTLSEGGCDAFLEKEGTTAEFSSPTRAPHE